MPYYAEIDEETCVVKRVIAAHTSEWCERRLGGKWIRTYYQTEGKRYAGKDFIYYPEHDNFSPPKPYASWILNTITFEWESPIPYPETDKEHIWDENKLSWVQVD